MAAPPSRLRALGDALDRRLGWRALARAAADEPVHGGARYAYVFGSALAFTFVIQALTGVTLASVYSPSITNAWGSVWWIETQMTLGWLVRGLHHFGSSAMVVLCVLHMTQIFLYGAWRAPREANWILGVLLLLLVLAFGLTGYLLPWDQKGYWATQVATSIMGSTPGGPLVQQVLQGGTTYGNLTITRFYALHVFVLPATLVLLLVGHVALFRRHGVTPSPRLDDAARARVETFWPYQVLKDLVFAAVVLAVLVALVLTVGASLEAPADPAGGYEARPEWYFLFLFQLLKFFEGPLVLVGTVVIPTLAIAFLLAVPWLDRLPEGARARPRARVAVPFFGLLLGVVALTAGALVSDARDPSFQEGRAEAEAAAARALELAEAGGLDAAGRVVLFEGERLFHAKACVSCHAREPDGPAGPLLAGYGTPERLDRFLRNPDADEFFGKTPLATGMFPFEGSDEDRAALVSWLLSLGGREGPRPDLVSRGPALFADADCTDCHNPPDKRHGDEGWSHDAMGPDLAGFLSHEWVRRLVQDAGHPDYFGDVLTKPEDREKAMPAYPDLTPDELDLLTRWLLAGAPGAEGSGPP